MALLLFLVYGVKRGNENGWYYPPADFCSQKGALKTL